MDWERVHRRDVRDAEHTFRSLKYEFIRHYFWHKDLDQRAINYALRKGMKGLREAAEHQVRKYLRDGIMPGEPTFDGRRASYEGNAIHYAQHGTSTCCRTCIQTWHDVPRDQELSEEQIGYFTELIMLYIKDRLPELPEEGQKVPPVRQKAA